jgi:glucosyl-3-phosphoglycerate phosphatase
MILLRHGQSEFNLHFGATRRDPGIVDPRLTELGHLQAADAVRQLEGERISRIITSPYTRTLQTAAPIAAAFGVEVLVNPIVRERYAFACDIGTPRTELARTWPQHDFSTIDEVWWPAIEEPAESIIGRAALFRAEMAALPDWSDTLVVSHWGFILSLTGKKLTNGEWLRCDPNGPAPEQITWGHV